MARTMQELLEDCRAKAFEAFQRHEYVTTKQAAFVLGVSPNWIIKMIRTNQLEALKPGRDFFVSMKSVEKLYNRRKPGRPCNAENANAEAKK